MAMEVRCGQCYGILLIETPGVVVACPHCGVHLSFPGTEEETKPRPPSGYHVDSNVETPYPFKLPTGFAQREPMVESVAVNPSSIQPEQPNSSDATPPAVSHPAGSQPVVSPPVVSPPVASPPVASQSVTSPPVVTQPVVTTHPPVSQEFVSHGIVSHQVVPQPVTTHYPPSSQPVVTQPVVTQPVVTQPVVTQPVVTQPVVTQPVVTQPAVTHPVVAHQVVQHQVVQHSVVQHPVVTNSVAPPTAQPPIAPPPSGPDFSWMSTPEPAGTSQAPSVPFTGLDLGLPNVERAAPRFATTPVSTGDAARVEPAPATGYAFSTPEIPVKSAPSGPLDIGTAGSSAATHPFGFAADPLPFGANDSALSDAIDPSEFVPPASSRSTTSNSRGSCLGLLLLIVGSYASLITIYAAYLTLLGRTHQLESLPDLKTVPQQGGRAVVPRPENDLPRGHELKLGQSQRYGNVKVTPLRVTSGPIKFEYFKDVPGNERAPSDPVLKLWLKFENVSDQQIITPIDSTLMYFQRGHSPVISYNVIFRDVDRKKKDGLFFYNFDRLPPESEWRIVGQDANRELLPHEEYETFIPSQESVELPSGEVIWRVHFRKGYGPKTGNGVTTLIDVRFDKNDIVPDPS